MEYRQVGQSGLTVSAAGLGCNNFGFRMDQQAADEVVGAALEQGVNFFDTAAMYGDGASEEILGRALGARRDEAVIATKFGAPRGDGPGRATGSRANIVAECEASLRRLGTDRIDLYYLHFPDRFTPIDETLAALDDLVRQGKVRYIAGSGMAGWQIVDAHHVAARAGTSAFIGQQFEWNLLRRECEAEIVPAAAHCRIGMIPFFPLASGMLTGKYSRAQEYPADSRLASAEYFRKDATEANFTVVEKLQTVAAEQGRTMVDLAIGWLLANLGVPSVIAGATSTAQLTQNAAVAADPLDADTLAAIDAVLDPQE